MADSVYQYRTPSEFPDRVRIGDKAGGDFSNLEHDEASDALELQIYNANSISGTWSFGADGLIRFNGDAFAAGGEFTSEQLEDIAAVADIAPQVVTVAENIDAIVEVADLEGLPDLIAIVGEIDAIQDNVALNAADAAASATAAAASETNAATSSIAAADSEGGAETAQAAAAEAADRAVVYATAPPDQEVEPGLYSARGYAARVSALARQIAAFPSRQITGTTAALIKSTESVRGDEFAMLYCLNSAPLTITLPRLWNDKQAFDGSPGWVPVRIINNGSSTVTLAGEAGTIVDDVVKTGTWQASRTTDAPVATTTVFTATITVPAGLKRVLWVGSFETNNSVTSHVVTLTSSSGTVTAQVSATAPTGSFNVSPRINAQSWTVALPNSASTATDVVLTFTLPANYLAHTYRIVAANNADAISGSTGGSITTPTLTPSVSVTTPLGSLVCAALAGNGHLKPATLTGATASAAIGGNFRENKDITQICGEIALASSGSHVISATFTSDTPPDGKQAAYLGVSLDKAVGGGSAVVVLGTPLTAGSDSWIDVMALSDGLTYIVKGGI